MTDIRDELRGLVEAGERATPLPNALADAHEKYRNFFCAEPHGTYRQMAAMAEYMPAFFAAALNARPTLAKLLRILDAAVEVDTEADRSDVRAMTKALLQLRTALRDA